MAPAHKAALLLLAFAFALAGCGGGEDTQTSTQSGVARGGAPPNEQSPGGQAKRGERPKEKDGAGGEEKGSVESKGSKANAAPLQVSGGGSARFEVKGGDNSVQRYGEEAEGEELREAAELVHSFYLARVAEEWEKACSYLSARTLAGLERLTARLPQLSGKGCAAVLDALSEPLSAALQHDLTDLDAAALRTEGEQGFLIYTGPPGETVYSMPLRLEGGEWKVGALVASVLPGTG